MDPIAAAPASALTLLDDGAPLRQPASKARMEGVAALSNEELLAVLLHGESADAGHVLGAQRLVHLTPLWRIPQLRPLELEARTALSPSRALRLLCALELGQRAARMPTPNRVRVLSPSDVASLCAPRMACLPRERVMALMLDRRQRLLCEVSVSEGWQEGCPVDPREVFRPALAERACGVILVHNHPSGDPTPSQADRELTRRLRDAGALIGIRLLDHVVVAQGGHASLAQEGLCS